MKLKTFLAAAAALSLLSAAASAKSPEERITALEQQLSALQKTYTANAADTVSAVESMKTVGDEFNTLKGQVEANARILQAQREELMKLIQDLQARVQTIEERMGVFTSQMTGAMKQANPQAGAEAEAYQQALDLATASKYLESASAFEAFLQKYPKSKLASSARFWVAENFYLSRDYKRAVKEYQVYLEKYPKDAKVAEALLKQGNCFYELGLYEESRPFYEKAISTAPGSKEAQQAKAKLAKVDEKKKSGATAAGAQKQGAAPAGAQKQGAAAAGAPAQTVPAQSEPAASPLSAYPTETLEQQRARMSGQPVPQPPTVQQPAKTEQKVPRVGPAAKEF